MYVRIFSHLANIVKLLLDHGASAEARNKSKESPITCAANFKVK